MVARVEAHSGLIEPFGVIEVAVAAEEVQMTLAAAAPLGLQIARAVAEAAAAIEHDVVVVRGFDPHARGPSAIHSRLGHVEALGISRQRLAADRSAKHFFDRRRNPAPAIGATREIFEYAFQQIDIDALLKRAPLRA